jgi:hypothetical protein
MCIRCLQYFWNSLLFLYSYTRTNFPSQNDPEVVLAACAQCGYALKHASVKLRATRSVVEAAVKQDGHALRFAADDLRSDVAMVELACQQNRTALRHALLLPSKSPLLSSSSSSIQKGEPTHSQASSSLELSPQEALRGRVLAESAARGLARANHIVDDEAGSARRGVIERGYAEFE